MASFKRKALRVFLLAVLGFLLIWLVRITDARYMVKVALQWISNLGPWAPFWFIIIYIVACLTFFPGFILTMGAGILFGVVKGTLFVSIGATVGAGLAFLLSRYFARDWVQGRFSANPTLRAIDEAVAREGWKIVGLVRLSPVFPFIPSNFVFGLTPIPFWQFFFVTWISIIPMSAMFVYLGSLLGEIAALGTKPIATGRMKWVISAIGVMATILVSLLVARIARKVLAEKLPEDIEAEE